MYNWPELPTLTKAEERLGVFAVCDYPTDLHKRDAYFREGLALLRTVKNQDARVRSVVASYLHFASDPALRLELETFLQTLAESPPAVAAKKEESR